MSNHSEISWNLSAPLSLPPRKRDWAGYCAGGLLCGPAAIDGQGEPVMLSAAGVQRKTARAPTCSTVVKLPAGLFFAQYCVGSLGQGNFIAFGAGFDLLLHQRSQHPSRTDGVAGDAGVGQFQRSHFGQADEAVLGGNVGGLVDRSHQAVHRGDVDDASPARALMPGSTAGWCGRRPRSMAMIASQRSAGRPSMGTTYWMPALLTRMSTVAQAVLGVADQAGAAAGLAEVGGPS